MASVTQQPIIRGIQTVGHAQVLYKYLNNATGHANELPIPQGFKFYKGATEITDSIKTGANGIAVAGFRLDGEFVRANPQIASSFVIPLLGGGGVALTNNNRTGTLNLTCAKVTVPALEGDAGTQLQIKQSTASDAGIKSSGTATGAYYDLVTLAQIQQAQVGGDAYGADITIQFEFSGIKTSITFEMCTVASVDPLGLAGNDAFNYNIQFNYLNWTSRVDK